MVLMPWLFSDACDSSGESDLEDDVDEWHQVCVRTQGAFWGLDAACDSDIMWLAEEAENLPRGWTDHVDNMGQVFFYNHLTEESTWIHPGHEKIAELIKLIKDVRAQSPPGSHACRKAAIDEQLSRVQQRAANALTNWSGPYLHTGEPYYYNNALDVSTWMDPVEIWEDELASTAHLLVEALLPRQSQQHFPTQNALNSSNILARQQRSRPPPIEVSLSDAYKTYSPASASFQTPRSMCSPRSACSVTPGCQQFSRGTPSSRAASQGRCGTATPTIQLGCSPRTSSSKLCSVESKQDMSPEIDLESLIAEFSRDPSQTSLKLPPNLTAPERKMAKALAGQHPGLKCESFGFGNDRQLHMFKKCEPDRQGVLERRAPPLGTKYDATILQDFTFGRDEPLRITNNFVPNFSEECHPSALDDFTFGRSKQLLACRGATK